MPGPFPSDEIPIAPFLGSMMMEPCLGRAYGGENDCSRGGR